MKFVITLLWLSLVVCSQALENNCHGTHLKTIYKKCVVANGGDWAHVEDLLGSRASRDENGKCFRACVMQECQFLNDDGKFNNDVPKKLAHILHGGNLSHVAPIEEAAFECVSLQSYNDTVCHVSEDFTRCLVKKSTVTLKIYFD